MLAVMHYPATGMTAEMALHFFVSGIGTALSISLFLELVWLKYFYFFVSRIGIALKTLLLYHYF